MTVKRIIGVFLVSVLLQGCSGGMNKQGTGTLIGGVTGALVGSQFGKGSGALVTTGIGALAGAFIGGQIGQTMDEHDRLILEKRSQQALENSPTGSVIQWNNPDNGHHGYVTPTKTFKNSNDQYCREYIQTIVIGNKEEKAYGQACRKPDGQWELVR